MFHFGGDEVPSGAWLDSPACRALIDEDEGLEDEKGLKEMFVYRVADIAHSHGLDIAGWEDGLMNAEAPFNRWACPSRGSVVTSGKLKAYILTR